MGRARDLIRQAVVPLRAGRRTLRNLRLSSLRLHRYAATPTLRVRVTEISRARFGVIDAHNHLGRWLTGDGSWMIPDVARCLGLMDELGIDTVVNLDGRWGDELTANLDRYDRAHPGRFVTFCHVDWRALTERNGRDALAASLRASVAAGAGGLK